jgi:leucyl aminopeptidase
MPVKISKAPHKPNAEAWLLLTDEAKKISGYHLSTEEQNHISAKHTQNELNEFVFNRLDHLLFVKIIKAEKSPSKTLENMRLAGDKFQADLNKMKIESVAVTAAGIAPETTLAFVEGTALGSYRFNKYFSRKNGKDHSLKQLLLADREISDDSVAELNILIDAIFKARDLVNEPANKLSATQLSFYMQQMGKDSGLKVEVFNKKKIESLKMGGLLSVNLGSSEPPTFTILEYKPENPVNEKPVVLVGKGVVFDTGGYNLKPGNSMENMKCDMGGAAMMAASVYAVALAKLPVHVVALIPATDNRVNSKAYVTGDIITMSNGLTVEIINTDAEGRLILADALSYARKFDPLLVINAATLTGSAMRAIGKYGIVAMQADAGNDMELLKQTGDNVYERIAEFPFWDEYGEIMKSDIADLKNAGGAEAGMITAGKFLEKFTSYPFIHLDIAGVAFAEKRDAYRGSGGTGYGVRLIYNFFKNRFNL